MRLRHRKHHPTNPTGNLSANHKCYQMFWPGYNGRKSSAAILKPTLLSINRSRHYSPYEQLSKPTLLSTHRLQHHAPHQCLALVDRDLSLAPCSIAGSHSVCVSLEAPLHKCCPLNLRCTPLHPLPPLPPCCHLCTPSPLETLWTMLHAFHDLSQRGPRSLSLRLLTLLLLQCVPLCLFSLFLLRSPQRTPCYPCPHRSSCHRPCSTAFLFSCPSMSPVTFTCPLTSHRL